MNYEDVQKVSNAAKAKSNLVNTNFFKYFIRAVMAGFFIDVAMIYSNVVGNVFSKTMPEWGKFVGALVFSIAVLLISFVGGELFTGNNMRESLQNPAILQDSSKRQLQSMVTQRKLQTGSWVRYFV